MKYFLNLNSEIPDIPKIEQEWPLYHEAFTLDFKNIPTFKPAIMPKVTNHLETNYDYYVSPRKIIRYLATKGFGYLYAETFEI
jgi:hypothetical protein